jgi:dTDP-4-amino-4,6-dideoxygalactose transaminase
MSIPFLDLKPQHAALQGEIEGAIKKVYTQTAFCGGPFVTEFEDAFAAYCGVEHALGVNSGTSALWAILLALGVQPGDEVITVPNSFIATAEAITFCGATPVFVDSEPRFHGMDANQLEQAIGPRTRAIVPVHLHGHVADMDPILKIARKHGLFVVEDACQAHGARYKERFAGSLGDAACFSFYPSKNLGACGEGGAVTTNNRDLAEKVRLFRDHGQTSKGVHGAPGWNIRMEGMQAAVLSVKLPHLKAWNAARRQRAAWYNDLLRGVPGLETPGEAADGRHVYHAYAIGTPKRDDLQGALRKRGIGTSTHYPTPIHLQPAYAFLNHPPDSFPMAERQARETLSLPMFPELEEAQIHDVARGMREALE